MPATKTVKMNSSAHAALKEMAAEDGLSITEKVSRLVEEKRRERFLKGANRDYAALREDEDAWQEVQREREEREGTLADGLKASDA
jgi:hypothetical protein